MLKVCKNCGRAFRTKKRSQEYCSNWCWTHSVEFRRLKSNEMQKLCQKLWKEQREKMVQGLRRQWTEERREKVRQQMLKQWQDPELAKKRIKGLEKTWKTKEHKERGRNIWITRRQELLAKFKRSVEYHKSSVMEHTRELEEQGFKCYPIGAGDVPVPDILAVKDGKIYAVEVEIGPGKPDYQKYATVNFFDDIIWIRILSRKKKS